MASKRKSKAHIQGESDLQDPSSAGLNNMQALASSLHESSGQNLGQNRTVSSFDLIDNPNFDLQMSHDGGDSFQDKNLRQVPKFIDTQDQGVKPGANSKSSKRKDNVFDEELKQGSRGYGTESKTRATTFIANTSSQNPKKRKYDEMDDGRLSAYNRRFIDDEAEESYGEEEQTSPQKKKVNARELEKHMKSKKQLYSCLTIEGQIYLPPEKECTATFMQQIMCGQKKYFLMSQIAMVRVPHLPELSASNILRTAMSMNKFRSYLPDVDHDKVMNRQYVFNIINSIDPVFFQQCIPEAYRVRQEQMALKQNKQVEMLDNFFNLITQSQMIGRDNKRGRVFTGFNKVCEARGLPLRKVNRNPPIKYSLGGSLNESSMKHLGHRSKIRRKNDDSAAQSTPRNYGAASNKMIDSLQLTLVPGNAKNFKSSQIIDSSQIKESIVDQTADSTQQPQIVTSAQQFII